MEVGGFMFVGDDGFAHYIDPIIVCRSTGFVDYEGRDIFTGDYIALCSGAAESLVFFDEDEGAFFYTAVPNGTGRDAFAGRRRQLTRDRAANKFIVGNIFEKLGKEWW